MRIAWQRWKSGKGLRPPDKVGINSCLSYRYNAGMTSEPKKHGRAARLLVEQRLTEKRNAASRNLDRMTAAEIVRLMNREDRKVAVAVGGEGPAGAPAVGGTVGAVGEGAGVVVGGGGEGRGRGV